MTFGRPSRLSQELAWGSTSGNNEALRADDAQATSPDVIDLVELRFWNRYHHLHLILGDVLSSFYTHVLGSDALASTRHGSMDLGLKMLDEMLHLDQCLMDWYNTLDVHLRLDGSKEHGRGSDVFQRQANVLYARLVISLVARPFKSS